MTTWARNVDNRAVDVVTKHPAGLFHSKLAVEFVEVPDGTLDGADYVKGDWINRAPVAPREPIVSSKVLAPMEFYHAFTPAERVKIKQSTDPIVADLWQTFEFAKQLNAGIDMGLKSVQDGLDYLIAQTILAPGRKPQILQGEAQ